LATGLVHSIPGVAIELRRERGDRLVVAHHRLDADMTPCELRAALIAEQQRGAPRVTETVTSVEVVAGLCDIGVGVYQRTGDHGEERWFATLLPFEHAASLVEHCDIDQAEVAVRVVLRPDPELGVTVVGLTCSHPAHGWLLDEVTFWVCAACTIHELVHELETNAEREHP
jgi:hypothetical protein